MAASLQFDLVSPERKLASVEATEVQIPGADGDMTAMADHAATITTLRPGILRVITASGADEYLVTGGFAEITATATSVLAEQAMPVSEVTGAIMDSLIADAEAAGSSDEAAKVVSDMQAARAALNV